MSIFNNPEENYWRNFATKTVLILITVAIIVWFLPRNEGRMFREIHNGNETSTGDEVIAEMVGWESGRASCRERG